MFIWYHKLKLAALKVKFNFKIKNNNLPWSHTLHWMDKVFLPKLNAAK